MKLLKLISNSAFVVSFVFLLFTAPVLATAQNEDSALDKPLGDKMMQEFVFKAPLVVPFALVSTEIAQRIESPSPHYHHFSVVFTMGRAIRVADVFAEDRLKFDYQSSDKLSGEEWTPTKTPDISFCAVTLKLTGAKNHEGYLVEISRPILPYIKSRKEPRGINFGAVTSETFGGYIELYPWERPNVQTGAGIAGEMPMIECHRHAQDNRGIRARDFIKVLGEDKVEMRARGD